MRSLQDKRGALARETLVKKLTEYQDFSGVHVVAVFDGQGEKPTEASEPGGIQIFYSGAGKTADDIIERLVATHGEKRDITVATDDFLEQQTVTTFGALCISSDGLKALLDESRVALDRRLKVHRSRVVPRREAD